MYIKSLLLVPGTVANTKTSEEHMHKNRIGLREVHKIRTHKTLYGMVE